MGRSNYLRNTSWLVLALSIGATVPAFAQTPVAPTTPAPEQAADDEVEGLVVTGSFLRGTSETLAIPVEGIDLEEIRNQGSPSNLDLIKGMSEIGSVAGEANRTNAYAIGSQSINLRSLSASRTVVVFNGRRFPEAYSFSVGRFNNVAQIPNAAIGRVEVLKDGGATTYGADAVGGVVNYITRRNLNGLELATSYRYIKDSDGDFDISLSGGKVFDKGNVLGVLSFNHRSELDVSERDWALQPYYINSAGWQSQGRTDGSPGSYIFQSGQTNATTITPLAGYTGNRQMGSGGVVRDGSCTQLGGFAGFNTTGSPVCYNQTGRISNLVERIDTLQAYAEVNYEFSDLFKLHGEFMYYGFNAPHVPIDNGGYYPQTYPLASPAGGASQSGPGGPAFFADGRNPAVAQFLNTFYNQDGVTTAYTPAQIAAITTGGRVALQTQLWRPFFAGGNGRGESADMQKNFTDQYRYTLEASGNLGRFAHADWDYTVSGTANPTRYNIEATDILANRLQAALNGLGGTGCTTATPGANGCQWFNPFSSGIASDNFTGIANPGAVTTGTFAGYSAGQGLQNSADLVKWMTVPLNYERRSNFYIFDALLRGSFDWNPLWTEEPIDIAAGAQFRQLNEVVDLPDLADKTINPCATPLVTNCASQTSPLLYNRGLYLIGFNNDAKRRYPVASGFFEFKLPVTDDFYVQASSRYEKFYSDVSPRDNDIVVSQFSARWQVHPNIALRGTIGQTFSNVNPPPAAAPSTTQGNAATAFGGAAVTNVATLNFPNLGVGPEKGVNYNVGAIVTVGNVRATADFYHIKIKGLARSLTSTDVLNAVALPGQAIGLNGARLLNCSSPLLSDNQSLLGNAPFVTLGSPCVQGTSNYLNTLTNGTVRFFGAQGQQTLLVNGADLETSGVDVSLQYNMPDVWKGDLTLTLDSSVILKYEISDFVFGGASITPGYEGVGFWNSSRGGQRVNQFRGSFGANYRLGRHNLNWSTRMISSVFNEDDQTYFTASALQNYNIGNALGVVTSNSSATVCGVVPAPNPANAGTGKFGTLPASAGIVGYDSCQNGANLLGRKIPATFNTDLTYTVDLPKAVILNVTVQNLFDVDPEFSRDQLNYDAFSGSPLGRTVRIGLRKSW